MKGYIDGFYSNKRSKYFCINQSIDNELKVGDTVDSIFRIEYNASKESSEEIVQDVLAAAHVACMPKKEVVKFLKKSFPDAFAKDSE